MNGAGEQAFGARTAAISLATAIAAILASLASAADRPNIVVIVSDDAGYNDFGFMAALNGTTTDFETPNLDALASSSVVMSSGYVSAPVCSPSRAGLLTGQYQERFGYEDNIGSLDGLEAGQQLVSHQLKNLGYTTGAIGKWHEGQIDGVNRPPDMGFDEFYGFLGGGRPYWGWAGADEPRQLRRGDTSIEGQWVHEGDTSRYDPVRGRYLTDAFSEEAADFINRHANDESPFMLYISFTAPHAPFDAKQQDLARFSSIADPDRRTLAAMTYAMDRAVGDVTSALTANALDENTIVVFMNDNGGPGTSVAPYNNSPLRGNKGSLWEGGIRVPFMMKAPGLAAGTYDQPVVSLDLLPTLVAAAGGDPEPIDTDGTDLMPFMTGSLQGDPHETLFWRSAGSFAVRKGDWKLVRPATSTFARLHNVAIDVHEDNYVNSQHPEIVQDLLRELTFWEATLEKPKWGNFGAARNRFDHFVFRNDVASASNWSTGSAWLQGGTMGVVTMINEDAYANAIVEFGTRDDADYTATNDLRRTTNQTFMLNQIRLTGSFSGLADRQGTINGNALLLVKNLAGENPQIRLEADSAGTSSSFGFHLDNELRLLDDLEITGDGTQTFIISGGIRDYFEPRNVTKSGTSQLLLTSDNTFGGTLSIQGGRVTLSGATAAISGAAAIVIGGNGNLALDGGHVAVPTIHVSAGGTLQLRGGGTGVVDITGSVVNDGGTIAPGLDPIATSISGDFTQASGTLEVGFAGISSASLLNRLEIGGAAFLGGTLDVDSLRSFYPRAGDSFEFLTAAGGVNGTMALGSLPDLTGDLTWNLRYEPHSVSLVVALPGDYNVDGFVDANDYTVWHDTLGHSVAPGNGADGNFDGQITEVDYIIWKAHFGASAFPKSLVLPPGDYTRDGSVDALDYALWRDTLGQSVAQGSGADGNSDGQITDADYAIWKSHFGNVAANVGVIMPPGDYNRDGTVDARDYAVWRDTLGQLVSRGSGADGNSDGQITEADYTVWKEYFGISLLTGPMILPPGDYTRDGIVDARDYAVWRDTLGQSVARGTGADGDFDGQITEADGTVWKDHFGATLWGELVSSLPGDYNRDGVVDARDYAVWRDTLGQSVDRGIGADGNSDGQITEADYTVWKLHFGATAASGSGATGSASAARVPEPATFVMLFVGLCLLAMRRRAV